MSAINRVISFCHFCLPTNRLINGFYDEISATNEVGVYVVDDFFYDFPIFGN